MKKVTKWIIAIAVILLFGVLIWRCAYENAKNPDNIPSLTLIKARGEAYADEKLVGYDRKQIIEVWGRPDGMLSGLWGDIWDFDNDREEYIIVYYDADGIVETAKFGTKSE